MDKENDIYFIGIDAITLNKLYIYEIIDAEKLIDNSNVSITYEDGYSRGIMTIQGKAVNKLSIKNDPRFLDLILGIHHSESNYSMGYSILNLTVSNILGNNLRNLTYEEYNKYIVWLINNYIPVRYGIRLYIRAMCIKSMEINANIPLSMPYYTYSKAIEFLIHGVKGRFSGNFMANTKKHPVDDNGKKITQSSTDTACVKNKSIKIQMYNKMAQLSKNLPVKERIKPENEKILRLEISITGKKAESDKVFGTSVWSRINDKIICDYFHSAFGKYFVESFSKYLIQSQKYLIKEIKKCRKNCGQKWMYVLMSHLRDSSDMEILDIEQVSEAIMAIPDKNNNQARTAKRLLNTEKMVENNRFFNDERAKILEIFSNEYDIYINSGKRQQDCVSDVINNWEISTSPWS